MNASTVLLIVAIFTLVVQHHVYAEFFYNRVLPKPDELANLDLKCVPGRTVIKVEEKVLEIKNEEGSSEEDDENIFRDTRRKHMTAQTKDEYCKVCVCSVSGTDEYCSRRPARNVNECLRMATLMQTFKENVPFEHERSLSFRIRRDYIWHDDEIPYDAKAKCRRGRSYYTNSISANDTDINKDSEIESLLSYSNMGICYYCVCSTDGNTAGCIKRKLWYCEYFRYLKNPYSGKDMYRTLFQQDRPTYFRQLSHRIRRTMEDGVYDLIKTGGDSICCLHPDGHRRNLHFNIRNKVRMMKKKVTKENLLSGRPGGDYVDFVVNNDK